jgi:DNA-directed RNA polymerase specialized sigma24 family protein
VDNAHTLESLDKLVDRAIAGDGRAEAALFEELRVRFFHLAKKRVQPDHTEDVVHDALGIVLRKYRERSRESGILVWSLTVLRNVIGNHYQARRRDNDRTLQVEDWQAVPAASLVEDPTGGMAAEEAADRMEAAITTLARKSPRCGAIFARILESMELGGGQRDISQRAFELVGEELPELTRNTFYVTLHRCRAQLRNLMDRTELGHV